MPVRPAVGCMVPIGCALPGLALVGSITATIIAIIA